MHNLPIETQKQSLNFFQIDLDLFSILLWHLLHGQFSKVASEKEECGQNTPVFIWSHSKNMASTIRHQEMRHFPTSEHWITCFVEILQLKSLKIPVSSAPIVLHTKEIGTFPFQDLILQNVDASYIRALRVTFLGAKFHARKFHARAKLCCFFCFLSFPFYHFFSIYFLKFFLQDFLGWFLSTFWRESRFFF